MSENEDIKPEQALDEKKCKICGKDPGEDGLCPDCKCCSDCCECESAGK